ncbi:DUF2071 domain-containing protein [Hymenobacter sp. GOD-10R]|uniref:YqjF family protein n=1 Tax=Hymenobacter sp. GOD-10R TaxID=3093922 RepID=UPI002D789A85|nr:DUF2071 domain-containing protein [Hymenobacter sp. GOD-10R]WRQ27426.1 DUF2071 domain-containing protein [Hymenobacter sp. GOD-10R]
MATKTTFLTTNWRYLLLANYAVDASVLRRHLPAGVELDDWNGTHYASMVGLLFEDTRMLGIPFPWHRDFAEVNLRFYVRRKTAAGWKQGVVFVKEIVSKPAIVLVANTLYQEKYVALPMRHRIEARPNGELALDYNWKIKGEWNYLRGTAAATAGPIPEDSEAEFLAENYWGFTRRSAKRTSEYEVVHPRWVVRPVSDYTFHCNVAALYGPEFVETLQQEPRSVFMADGSAVKIMSGEKVL